MNPQSQQLSLKAVILSNLSYLHTLLRALKFQTSLLLLTSQPRQRTYSLRPLPISQPRPCMPLLTAQPSPGQSIATSFQSGQQRSSSTPSPGELGFTPQQVESARPLDLGLANLLRHCDVKEAVIQAFRVRGITDRLLFLALDDTTESLRSSCKEALGIDTSAIFEHKLELARISKAWSSAKIAAETKQKIDAIHRAHGEPVQMLEGDWANMIRAFKLKYGKQIHPSRLPAQSYYEAYEEKLANTTWRAETLAHVTSLQEEEKHKALRPEPSRSVGIHLDSSLSIQTQRRFVAKMPTNIEDLRTQYKVMATMFLLAKMRQPSRHLYKDLEVNTFSDFLDELLSDRNMEGGDDDNLMLPPWSECLNYEFQIRKEAVRLCMEEGFSIKRFTVAHLGRQGTHDAAHHSELASGVFQDAEDGTAVCNTREQTQKPLSVSTSSAEPAPSQHALMPPQQLLALPASGTQQKGKSKGQKGSKGKGKGKGKGNKTLSSNSSSTQGFRNFQALYKLGWSVRKHFQKDTCWKFQSNVCQDASCLRKHACVGCGKANVHYDSCGCMESTIPRA